MSVVVGAELVTPRGATLAENVFFLRAGVRTSSPSPFVDAEGEPLRVQYCPWLGAALPLSERITRLVAAALRGVAPALPGDDRAVGLHLVLDERVGADVVTALEALARATVAPRALRAAVVHHGAAGAFAALSAIGGELADAAIGAAVLVAVDSFFDEARLAEVLLAPSPWARRAPSPSEGVAALILTDRDTARAERSVVLAEVLHSATTVGEPGDDNDLPVDGWATTALLHGLAPQTAPIVAAFGQSAVDALRTQEWMYSTARTKERFSAYYQKLCLESAVGLLGAASGAASLAFLVGVARHQAFDVPSGEAGNVLAWALSSDRTRGLALLAVPDGAFRDAGLGGGFDGA